MASSEIDSSCSICLKNFDLLCDLQVHMTNEHPDLVPANTCCICRLTFNLYQVLIQHFRIHSGLHPYTCYICQKSFVQLNQLTMHLSTLHNVVYCSIDKDLKRSMYNRYGDLPSRRSVHNGSYSQSHGKPLFTQDVNYQKQFDRVPDPQRDVTAPVTPAAPSTRVVDIDPNTVTSRSGRVLKPKLSYSPSRSPMKKSPFEQRLVKKYMRMHAISPMRRSINRTSSSLAAYDSKIATSNILESKAIPPRCNLLPLLTSVSAANISGATDATCYEVSNTLLDISSRLKHSPAKLDLNRLKSTSAFDKIKYTISQHSAKRSKRDHETFDCISGDTRGKTAKCAKLDNNDEHSSERADSATPTSNKRAPVGLQERGLFSLFSDLYDNDTSQKFLSNQIKAHYADDSQKAWRAHDNSQSTHDSSTMSHPNTSCKSVVNEVNSSSEEIFRQEASYDGDDSELLKYKQEMFSLLAFRSKLYCLVLVTFPKLRRFLRTINKDTSQIDEFLDLLLESSLTCSACSVCPTFPRADDYKQPSCDTSLDKQSHSSRPIIAHTNSGESISDQDLRYSPRNKQKSLMGIHTKYVVESSLNTNPQNCHRNQSIKRHPLAILGDSDICNSKHEYRNGLILTESYSKFTEDNFAYKLHRDECLANDVKMSSGSTEGSTTSESMHHCQSVLDKCQLTLGEKIKEDDIEPNYRADIGEGTNVNADKCHLNDGRIISSEDNIPDNFVSLDIHSPSSNVTSSTSCLPCNRFNNHSSVENNEVVTSPIDQARPYNEAVTSPIDQPRSYHDNPRSLTLTVDLCRSPRKCLKRLQRKSKDLITYLLPQLDNKRNKIQEEDINKILDVVIARKMFHQ